MRRFARFGTVPPALAAAWSLAGPALAQQPRPDYYYGPHMWGGGYGWFMGPIMWLLFIAIAVIVVVLLVRWLGVSGAGAPTGAYGAPGKTPLDLLKERFAKGEIDKKEFEERRKVLEQ